MLNLKQILIVVTVLVCFSCTPENCFTPPTPVLIRIVDSGNIDLLNPANPNSYNINNIQLFYIDNGSTKTLQVQLNNFPATDSFFLSTDVGWHANRGRTFYLKLSNSDTDTLFAEIDHEPGDCSYFVTKTFSYNGNTVTPKGVVPGMPYVYQVVK